MSSKLPSWFKWSDTDVTSWVFNSFSITFFYCLLFFGNIHLVQIVYEIGQNTWVCWSWAWKINWNHEYITRMEIYSENFRNFSILMYGVSETSEGFVVFSKYLNFKRNIFSLRFLTHKIESLPTGSTLWFIGPSFEVPMNINLEITMLYYQDENSWKITNCLFS